MHQLRHAFRALSQSTGFTVIAVLTLALGIGFSTSSFSMANTFLLRNVPYPDADRLVRIFGTTPQSQNASLSPANALDVRTAAASYRGIVLYHGDSLAFGEPGQPAQQVNGLVATANFFNVIGVQPALGRGFAPGEDEPGKQHVAVLSHRGWMRVCGGSPTVIGRTLRLNLQTYTVIGVLPASFDAPLVWGPVDVVVPRTIDPDFTTQRSNAWLQVFGRLKPDITLRQAQTELDTIGAQLRRAYPKENGQDGLRVVDLYGSNMDSVSRSMLWLMTALSLTMLLIACANLASLQVARAFARSREFAVRCALGGSRAQLMVPLLFESLMLSAVGGCGGLLVGKWSNDIIGSLLRINGELGFVVPIDGRVLTFAALASLVSGVAFGIAPAWLASRAPAADALKEGSRGATGSRSHQRLKNTLIIGELGLALALVGVAASFGVGTKTFLNRQVGWQIDGLFSGNVVLPYVPYNDDAKSRAFQRDLLERLHALPGVERAAIATGIPLYSLGRTTRIAIESESPVERGREPTAEVANVSPDYFSALRLPLQRGALFADSLSERDPPVTVVNEAFARRFWSEGSALGHRVRFGDSDTWLEIIGVVGDARMKGRFDTPATRLQAYRPLVQSPSRYLGILLRTSMDPDSATREVRTAVASIDPDLPVTNAGSLQTLFDGYMSNLNLIIVNLGLSAGMGLLIAAIGVFGVVSQLIAQRTRDIGVRIALGAQRGDVLRMIMAQGVRFLLVGTLVGTPLFFLLNAVLQRAIPEMALPGLWLLGTNLAVIACAMLSACWLPARRATLINPVEALRAE